MTVVALSPPRLLPRDLPATLRDLADRVERGDVTEMVVGFCERDGYEFLWPSSLHQSLILCVMLQQTAIDRMRR